MVDYRVVNCNYGISCYTNVGAYLESRPTNDSHSSMVHFAICIADKSSITPLCILPIPTQAIIAALHTSISNGVVEGTM